MNSASLEMEITISREQARELRRMADAAKQAGEPPDYPFQLGGLTCRAMIMEYAELANPTKEDADQVRIKIRVLGY